MKRKSIRVVVSVAVFLSALVALAPGCAGQIHAESSGMGSHSLSSEDTRAGRLSPSVRTET